MIDKWYEPFKMKMGKIKLAGIFFNQNDGTRVLQPIDKELSEELTEYLYGEYQWSVDDVHWNEPNNELEESFKVSGLEPFYRYKGLNY